MLAKENKDNLEKEKDLCCKFPCGTLLTDSSTPCPLSMKLDPSVLPTETLMVGMLQFLTVESTWGYQSVL